MLFISFAFMNLLFNEKINDGKITDANQKNNIILFSVFCIFVFLSIYFYNLKPLYSGIEYINFMNAETVLDKKILAEKFLSKNTPYSDELSFRFANESFLDVGEIADPDYGKWALETSDKKMQAVLLRHPGDYSYFHALGNIFLREGSLGNNTELLDRAISLYLKALEISPKRQATMFQLATAYIMRGRADEAVVLLKKAVADDDKIGQSHWRLAIALLKDGKKEDARASFEESLRLGFVDSMINEIRMAVGLCAEFKDYACAVDIYEKFIDKSPASADLYAQLAAAYAASGRYEEAKGAVIKAVELDPSLEAEAAIFLKQIGY